MKKLIVANWKNHPNTLAEAEQILDSVDEYLGSLDERELSLIFCPPFVFLEEAGKLLKTSHLEHNAELGAQDIATDDNTALTGEVSGVMLNELGVRYVIVGHSERRWKLGETDEVVNKKLKASLKNEFVPIVCLGEKVRDENFREFLTDQTKATFADLSSDEIARCVIAYEPVWAISTTPGAHSDTPESATESIKIIEDVLVKGFKLKNENLPKMLYGGSVTSANAREFFANEELDGVLVGGASVKKEEFVKILSVVRELGER